MSLKPVIPLGLWGLYAFLKLGMPLTGYSDINGFINGIVVIAAIISSIIVITNFWHSKSKPKKETKTAI